MTLAFEETDFETRLADAAAALAAAPVDRRLFVFQDYALRIYAIAQVDAIAAGFASEMLQDLSSRHDIAALAGGEEALQHMLSEASRGRRAKVIDGARRWDTPQIIDPPHLPILRASAWQGTSVQPRRWLVPHRIPMANVTLLNGDGAAGKTTIMLQLAVSTCLGTDWLGAVLDEGGAAIFFSGEEDEDEIHRRLEWDLQHRGVDFRAIADLHVLSMPDEDVTLGEARDGIIIPTKLFHRLAEAACDIRPKLLAIEAAADVFAGNENNRTEVRQFMSLLRRLARKADTAVLLAQHPSLSGLNGGTGASGSTHWNNAARSRLYFTRGKTRDGEDAELDARELHVMKANYGPAGDIVRLRWHRGIFVPLSSPSTIERAAAENAADEVFLRCLDLKRDQGIEVVHTPGRGYAPAVFAGMQQAKGYSSKILAQAMERLLNGRRIRVDVVGGPPSKPKKGIVRAT